MKKLISLSLVGALALTLAACGGPDPAPTSTPEPTPTPVVTPEPMPESTPTPTPTSSPVEKEFEMTGLQVCQDMESRFNTDGLHFEKIDSTMDDAKGTVTHNYKTVDDTIISIYENADTGMATAIVVAGFTEPFIADYDTSVRNGYVMGYFVGYLAGDQAAQVYDDLGKFMIPIGEESASYTDQIYFSYQIGLDMFSFGALPY